MATKSKATKGGNYICKVGYFDIRQKNSERKKTKGVGMETSKSELVIYHGGKMIEGGFNSKEKAVSRAKELLGDNASNYGLN